MGLEAEMSDTEEGETSSGTVKKETFFYSLQRCTYNGVHQLFVFVLQKNLTFKVFKGYWTLSSVLTHK